MSSKRLVGNFLGIPVFFTDDVLEEIVVPEYLGEFFAHIIKENDELRRNESARRVEEINRLAGVNR